jgi:hypothetical protein
MEKIDLSTLPIGLQVIVYSAGLIVSVAVAAFGYFKIGAREPRRGVNEDVQVIGGAFADSAAVHTLAESFDGLAKEVAEFSSQARRLTETRERTPESIERQTQVIEKAADRIERAIERLGDRVDSAARFMRSNL